jgi:hypothetical protein
VLPDVSNGICSFPWKQFFHLGIEIKQSWSNFGDGNCKDDILYADINYIKNEIYSSLKEYIPLPKLRKENLILENELNSSFQTHLFDILNDHEDLYEFYSDFETSLLVRNDTLPLTDSLENIGTVMEEFVTDSQKKSLAKLRWYSADEWNKYFIN